MPRKGFFLVLDGPDLSGKSTQAVELVRRLKPGRKVLHTREPGGTFFSEAIRRIVLDPRHKVMPLAELLLYEAARAQHVEELVRPALASGTVVVCERFTMATMAYQGYGRGLPLALVRSLNRAAAGGLEPDLTLVVDVPEKALRTRERAVRDRLESEPASFMRRVRQGYRRLARGPRAVLIDGGRSPEQVARDIWERVRKALP